MTESEGVDTTERQDGGHNNRILSSKQCEICDFNFFRNRNFNYRPNICDECHFITLRSESLDNIKVLNSQA